MDRRRLDRRIEAARPHVRSQRRAEQAAVAAGVDEPGEQLRIRAPAARLAEQPHHRVARAPAVDVDLRHQVVGQRQIRIQLEGALQRGLRAREVALAAAAELADQPVQTAEPRPRRRIAGIFLRAPAGRDRARSPSSSDPSASSFARR